MKPIVLLDSPILPGTNLIEASAGTGKTQTIAGLFLRLLLEVEAGEGPIQVDQILVREFAAMPRSSLPLATLAANLVDQNAPHGLGSGGEKVPATVPVPGLVHVHEPEIGLMDQAGSL